MNFKKAIVVVASLALLSSPCYADDFANGIGNDVEEQAYFNSYNGNYTSSGSLGPMNGTGADAWGYNSAGSYSISRALDNPQWGTAEVRAETDTPDPLVGATHGNVLGADVAASGSISTAHSETHADAKGDFTRGGYTNGTWFGGNDVEVFNTRPSNNIGPYPGMVDTSGGLSGYADQGSWANAQQKDTWAAGGQTGMASYDLMDLDDEQTTVVTDGWRIKPGCIRPGGYLETGYIHSEHEAYGDAMAAGGTVAFAYDRPNFAAAGGITAGVSGADVDVVKGDNYDTSYDAQGNGAMQHSANINGNGFYGESNGFGSYDYNGYKSGGGIAGTVGYTAGDHTGGVSVSKGFAASTGGISNQIVE